MKKKSIMMSVLLLILVALSACGGKKIEVNKMFTPKFSGVDGYGTISFDTNQVYQQQIMLQVLKLKANELTEQKITEKILKNPELGVKSLSLKEFMESISLELEKKEINGNLKNGDKVKAILKYNAEKAKELGLRVDKKSETFTVKGLTKPTKLDVLKDTDVEFSGGNELGKAKINTKDNLPVKISYSLSKSNNLKNGDVVTLSADIDKDKLARQGYIVEETNKEYVVSGLKDLKEIDIATLAKGYDVTVKGILPNEYIEVKNILENDFKSLITYKSIGKVDPNNFTVKIAAEANEEKLTKAGYKLPKENLTFEHKVDSNQISYYVKDVSQLTAEDKELILDKLEEAANNYANKGSQDLDSRYYLEKADIEYLKEVSFAYEKNKGENNKNPEAGYNKIIAIFKITGYGRRGITGEIKLLQDDLYIAAGLKNVLKGSDGKIDIDESNIFTSRCRTYELVKDDMKKDNKDLFSVKTYKGDEFKSGE